MNIGDLPSLLTTLAIIAGVVIYWRKGGNAASVEVLSTFKMQIDAQKAQIEELQKLHRENLGEIGKLRGIIEEKDKRLMMFEQIVQNRNPELIDFMKYMTNLGQKSDAFMQKSAEREDKILMALQEAAEFMGKINEHFNKTKTA